MTAFRQRINLMVDRTLSPAALSARLAAAARKARDDLIASGRASATYTTFVDGSAGASEDSATRLIRYEFTRLGDAVQYALDQLMARSPVKSGTFRDSFMVAVNGRAIPARNFVARSVPVGAECFVYNTQSYARKLDVQLIGKKPIAVSVPANFFDAVASAINRRYGNTVKAERLYTLNVPGAYRLKRGRLTGSQVHTPALAINPR